MKFDILKLKNHKVKIVTLRFSSTYFNLMRIIRPKFKSSNCQKETQHFQNLAVSLKKNVLQIKSAQSTAHLSTYSVPRTLKPPLLSLSLSISLFGCLIYITLLSLRFHISHKLKPTQKLERLTKYLKPSSFLRLWCFPESVFPGNQSERNRKEKRNFVSWFEKFLCLCC